MGFYEAHILPRIINAIFSGGAMQPLRTRVCAGLEGDVVEWLFSAAPPEVRSELPKFRTPLFTRTLSQWLNLLIDAGFRLERLAEPRPTDETVGLCPALQDAQVVSYFLHIRARRPE